MSVHVNVSSDTEPEQLADLGRVAHECERLGMPLLAMMYARGATTSPEATSGRTLAHLAAIATDLGADVVKLDYAGTTEAMDQVVDSCPLPILVAGGPAAASDDAAVELGCRVAESRVAGLSFGRQIFGADDPSHVATALAAHLHDHDPRALQLA